MLVAQLGWMPRQGGMERRTEGQSDEHLELIWDEYEGRRGRDKGQDGWPSDFIRATPDELLELIWGS